MYVFTINESSIIDKFEKPAKAEIYTKDELELLEYYRSQHQHFHWSVKKTVAAFSAAGIPVNQKLIEVAWLECLYCSRLRKVAPLSKLKFRESPKFPFEEVHIDHIITRGERKSSDGHIGGFSFKCALTRYFLMFPVKSLQITEVVNQLKNVCMTVGRKPKMIYADNAFDSKTMLEFCEKNNIELRFRVSNLSRSNTVEATHRPFHAKVSAMLGHHSPSRWHTVAWKAAMSLNCQPHSIVGFTPYYLFFGRHPEYYGAEGIPDTIQYDEFWLKDLQLAAHLTNEQRKKQSSDQKYPTFPSGTRLLVRPDGSKNASNMAGTVVEDNGGSSLLIKLDGRPNPIAYHKGMLRAEKQSDAWLLLEKNKNQSSKISSPSKAPQAVIQSENTEHDSASCSLNPPLRRSKRLQDKRSQNFAAVESTSKCTNLSQNLKKKSIAVEETSTLSSIFGTFSVSFSKKRQQNNSSNARQHGDY